MTDPYATLVELARIEAELVADGRWDEVLMLAEQRTDLIASLPDAPPAEAADALREAWRLVLSSTGAASVAVAESAATLRRLRDGRRAIAGYARSA